MSVRRVLIVDDEPYILRILGFKLRRAGYEAVEATSAEQALEALAVTAIHCIILDVTLATPVSGFDLAARLREDPRLCRIPVVFLTARTLVADVRLGHELGAAAFITKPFSLQQVVDEVLRLAPLGT
ncbi:MAG: response regulator [Thermoanaerobaculaceae bacterium]|nr:response regulator [Thermoanaerobaculaceae bacterium]MDI9621252.1 response regulator [Acidobacteriota bacterium]NLH12407.1 response regulator [Holophagae bacterium]HPW54216.1 response regulator [Thermoanaerobaculaceae bacterium]